MFVSGLGSWDVGLVTPALDLSFGSWAFGPASFLIRNYVCFWTWKLGRWTCHSSIGLVFLKLGLRPSFILNKKLSLFLDLEAGPALDLSSGSWALGPASFLIRNYVCFWNWILGHCTRHSSIGLVFLKLGLRPSFILNKKIHVFLDVEAGTLDLSLQH